MILKFKNITKRIINYINGSISNPSYLLLILIVFILLVPIILLLKNTSKGPAFKKTGVFSSWEYQASLPSSSITVSAKSESDKAIVDFQYQNSSIQFDYSIDKPSIKQSKDNEITFTSKDKNVLTQYQILPNSLKESIILYQLPSSNKFTSSLKITNADVYLSTENLPVFLHPQSREYLFHIQKPYAVDAAGNKTYALSYELLCSGQSCTYPAPKNKLPLLDKLIKLNQSENYQLIIKLDSEWLNDRGRVLPIIIDPTIVHDTSSEFATGQLNRVKDTGSGSSPSLESYFQELGSDPNTVALWHLNETSGNAIDASGNGYTGTIVGNVPVVSGKHGNARSFDGSNNSRIEIGDYSAFEVDTATIEAWVNFASGACGYGDCSIFSKGESNSIGYGLSINRQGASAYASLRIKDTQIVLGSTPLNSNTWYHIAGSFDGNRIRVYVNGNLDADVAQTIIPTYSSEIAMIGTANTNKDVTFNGYIDEVRISNIALSAEEIRLDASRRPYSTLISDVIDLTNVSTWNSLSWTGTGFTTGDGETLASTTSLVAQWNFNETSGTTADNAQGTAALDGTLTNFALTSSQDQAPSATGGTISYSGGYTIHTFNAGGTFTVNTPMNVEILVVGGGGGGGDGVDYANNGGGGGAGGLIYQSSHSVSTGNFPIVVGNGGARNTNGQNSTFDNLTAVGGGKGGAGGGAAGNGGSGGGACPNSTNKGTGTSGQGYNGANGATASPWAGGGGGGASELGSADGAGLGGDGTAYSISGSSVIYAGGGSGGNDASRLAGGDGGGGSGAVYSDASGGGNGTANTGGGGGGGASRVASLPGGTGGSGIVIIRYPSNPSGWTANNRRWGAGALMFDGVDDYVNLGDNAVLQPTSNLSVESWFKTTSTADMRIVRKRGYGYSLNVTSGKVSFLIVNSAATAFQTTSTQKYNDGLWHHAVGTYNGSTVSVYVDGQNVGSTAAGTIYYSAGGVSIGRDGDYSGSYFQGIIDSTRIYSRALTASEILSNFNSSRIEFQARFGSSSDPNDGTWEAWKPTTNETAIASLDSDSANWSWDNTATYMPKSITNSTVIKQEGTSSLKIESGIGQTDANTVGLWHLDETGGTGAYLKDLSSSANHGTPTGTTVTDGITNKARSFNGSSDFITLPSGFANFTGGFTVELWAKPTAAGFYSRFIDFGETSGTGSKNILFYRVDTTNNLMFTTGNGSAYASISATNGIINNEWHHYAGSVDSSGNAYIYRDGQIIQSGALYVPANVSRTYNFIGKSNWTGGDALFQGYLDEIKISNTARSAEQIAESYRMGRDHYLNRTISSTNLSAGTNLPFYVASDRLGTFSQLTIGESPFANYQPDANTIGLWHLDESVIDSTLFDDFEDNNYNGWTIGDGTWSVGSAASHTALRQTCNGCAYGMETIIGSSSWTDYSVEADIYTPIAGVTASHPGLIFRAQDTANYDYIYFRPHSSGTTSAIQWGYSVSGALNGVSMGTATIPWDTWYHAKVTISGTTASIYINGVLINTYTPHYSTGKVGVFGHDSTVYFDNVRVIANSFSGGGLNSIKDSSSNVNNGTPVGTTSTQGKLGKARSFNGTSDYMSSNVIIEAATSSNLQTFDGWVYNNGVNGWGIFGSNADSIGEFHLHVQGDNASVTFRGSYYGGFAGDGQNTVSVGVNVGWHHVAVVKIAAKTFDVYLDGTRIISSANKEATLSSNFFLGQIWNASFYSSIIDEVRVSNVARSADQIRQAYEIGARTHNITFDFKAKLGSGNLIANSSDLSFTVDETPYGSSAAASHLFLGDKIIVKENYNGTEYIAQGTVNAVTLSTGAVTVSAWDSGSTFPASGFTVNATVLKWQREYFNITNSLSTQRDAITQLSYRITDGSEGASIWLDDLRSSTGYLNNSIGSTITPSALNRYFQYRTIFTQNDLSAPSSSLTSVTFDYTPIVMAANCLLEKSTINDFIKIKWLDQSTSEDGFTIQKKTDGGAYSDLLNLSAGTTAHTDSAVSSGHSYQYRIAPFVTGPIYGTWCETSTLDLELGSIKFEGIKMEGIKIN